MRFQRKHLAVAVAGVCLSTLSLPVSALPTSLTLFHNNDGESTLLGSNGFGGFEYFLGELETARTAASAAGRDVLTLSSGDNFLAGIAFEASQDRRDAAGGLGSSFGSDNKSSNYYDAMALAVVGYDAITLGNHDFDFGPGVLGDFINGYRAAGGNATFLSANLDFSAEPALSGLTNTTPPVIAASTIVQGDSGEQYGIVGATTQTLANISSPGASIVINDVASAIQAEVDALQARGVNKIILSTHLQSIANEQQLVPLLNGVDVVVAGGGDELLANTDDSLTSNPFQPNIEGPYPIVVDSRGTAVPIVTTVGEYRYVGRLEVEFDDNGNVTGFGGDPILVDPSSVSVNQATGDRATAGGVVINIEDDLLNPLQQDFDTISQQIIGSTEVFLNGIRADIRSQETNLGNLVTDAFVFSAKQLGGLDPSAQAVIGVTNGGGIRAAIEQGEVTNADVISVLPFANSLVVINGISVSDLVSALENAVSNHPETSGGFLQVSGLKYSFNQYTGKIFSIALEDGTELYNAMLGGVLEDITLDLVTNSFTAAGGDGFDEFARYVATDLGISYAEALRLYIRDGLGGVVSAADYADTQGRIAAVPVPSALALLTGGMIGLGWRRSERS